MSSMRSTFSTTPASPRQATQPRCIATALSRPTFRSPSQVGPQEMLVVWALFKAQLEDRGSCKCLCTLRFRKLEESRHDKKEHGNLPGGRFADGRRCPPSAARFLRH